MTSTVSHNPAGLGNLPARQNIRLPDPSGRRASNQPQAQCPQPGQPDHARQLAFPVRCQRLAPSAARTPSATACWARTSPPPATRRNTPYSAARNFFGEQMDRLHQRAAADVGNHQPAALPEKSRVMRRGRRRGRVGFSLVCGHGRWTIREPDGSGKRFQEVQAADFCRVPANPAKSIRPPCAPARCRRARTLRWECRPRDNTAASQKKSTPTGRVWPTLRRNCRTSGSFGFVSSGRHGASFVLEIFADNFFARSNAVISRRTPASVSPGSVRRSIVMAQRSGTMFGWVPPEIMPTFTVPCRAADVCVFATARHNPFRALPRCAPFRGRHFGRAAAWRHAPPCRAFRVAATNCPCAR